MKILLKYLLLFVAITSYSEYASGFFSCTNSSTISSDFNGTSINGGNYIWFNSHLKLSGQTKNPTIINIDGGVISFTANGLNYSFPVPKTQIVFSSSTTTASTFFNAVSQTFLIQVPLSTSGDVFSGGFLLPVPSGGFPGGIKPVTWKANFSGNTGGLSVAWQWSAAVYTSFSNDYNALGIASVDGSVQSGTPNNFKNFVTGGARGGGGSNTTGSNSSTGSVIPIYCPGALSLGNQVWNDFDGDGKRDSNEPGIPNIVVSLYADNNYDNLPDGLAIGTTTSDANGRYKFSELVEGRYIASIPIAPGYQQSPNASTSATSPFPDNDIDNDNNAVTLVGPNGIGGIVYSNAITLTDGIEPIDDGDGANGNNTFDLALCGVAFIGDFVWNDLNANGIQDANEPGINGVTVTITFQDGTTASTTTSFFNNDGYYDFKNLGPGTFTVSFSTPSGFFPSPSNIGTDDSKDSDPINGAVSVTVAAGVSNFTIDAGFTNQSPSGGGTECFGQIDIGCQSCAVNYPDNSNLPRSAVVFNESEVLRYAEPGPSTCGNATSEIRMYYGDEHAMTLGVKSVVVKTSSGTTTTNYPITPKSTTPGCVINPLVGSTISSGDQAGNDVAAGGGRPLWPALFITDLTTNGSTSRVGDWQQGGTGVAPHKICGTWKSATRTVDKTTNPEVVTVTPESNPTKNNWTLGAGSDVPAVGFSSLKDEGFGTEVVWNVSQLGLLPGHTYRLQFMVHDGDQNKTGGDVGQSCTTIVMGGTGPDAGADGTAKSVWTINSDNTVTIKTTLDKTLVDNTYGTGAIGWPSAHTFNDLVTSDNMQMELYDAVGVKKMDFKMDYLSASSSAPSGYKSLGVTGGDGSISLGSSANVLSVKTSLDSNLNEKGYVLTSNSPATNSSYAPNATYPNWNFNVVYEAKVSLSAFGTAGFGYPKVVRVHASPSKIGKNDIDLKPSICPGLLKLGNQVWNDYDGDGKRDLNEPGVANLDVYLYVDNNGDNMPEGDAIRKTTTDINGNYIFTDLKPGRYIASIQIPIGYQQSPNTSTQATSSFPDNNVDNDNNAVRLVGVNGPGGIVYTNAITLSEGGEPTTDGDDANGNQTFDLAMCGSLFLGDFVWDDVNANGIQDANEPGINGVIVTITFQDGRTATTTSQFFNNNGYYDFKNLGPGTYKITFTTPAGYFPSRSNLGTDDMKDSDPIDGSVSVTLVDASNFTIDAGFTTTTPAGGEQCFGMPNIGCVSCAVAYPDNSNLPRSAVVFNESEVLRYAEPGPSTCGNATTEIKMYYGDEHAMTLGVRSVVVKTSSGTTTTTYPITPAPSTPGCVVNPLVGTTIASGDQTGNDVADGGGRPLWPALFITDLTVNGATSRVGDWQQGGTGVTPHKICGTWKGAVRTVDKTRNPAVITVTPDANPAKNNWTLGAGSDMPDIGFANLRNEGYGTEVVWNVSQLGLLPGHTYRLQFMVHDGDQNKTGGDVGQSCTTIVMGGGGGTTNADGTARTTWFYNPDNTVTIKTLIAKSVVDNTYGTNKIGWPSTHNFTDLTTSDDLRLALYDGNGTKKMDFTMDYLSASASTVSGYRSLGVTGGDGSIPLGNATDITSVKTSLDANFNDFGYVLTSNSPSTNNSYATNSTYPNWIYDVWYEAKVKLSAFGPSGFGYPELVNLHASPSKIGKTDITLNPTPCPIIQSRSVEREIVNEVIDGDVSVYPNPASTYFQLNFKSASKGKVIVRVMDVSGKSLSTQSYNATIGSNTIRVENLSRLASGSYNVELIVNNKKVNKKLRIIR